MYMYRDILHCICTCVYEKRSTHIHVYVQKVIIKIRKINKRDEQKKEIK